MPRNLEQDVNGAGVTILDYRHGTERVHAPPTGMTVPDTEQGGRGCRLVGRELARNLGWQNIWSTVHIHSRYLGGASSYMQRLTKPVGAQQDGKIHVPSHRGLFAGQTLYITGEPASDGDVVTIKRLGLDQDGPYFEADLLHNHPEKALVYNKNWTGGLTVEDVSNCDNQSGSLNIHRKTYGNGDTFGLSLRLGYQGDSMSGGGDEGGVGVSSQIEHDLNCFWGVVESWNPRSCELVYAAQAENPHKLGTSRPLINMNPGTWITSGKARVTRSRILGTPETGWNQSVIGRFITVIDPSECLRAG